MALTADDVFQAAFELPLEDRKALVDRLLETLEGPDQSTVQQNWQQEVERRVKAIENGTAKLIPAAEVFDSAQKRVHQ